MVMGSDLTLESQDYSFVGDVRVTTTGLTGDYTLEVREGNTAARALYESFGFVTEGVRRNYYTQPSEDALIMWRRIRRDGAPKVNDRTTARGWYGFD